MTGRTAAAAVRAEGGKTEVRLQVLPGETRLLRIPVQGHEAGQLWPALLRSGEAITLGGRWQVAFVDGGPTLPQSFTTEKLDSWTALGDDEAKRFAGAARYTISFQKPERAVDRWVLDLGDVRESARVWVNGQPAGLVFAHPFRVDVSPWLKPGQNRLEIEVTNLSANRIRDLDIRKVAWKRFYDINFVGHDYKPFDASGWELKPSGLLGPVTLVPYQVVDR